MSFSIPDLLAKATVKETESLLLLKDISEKLCVCEKEALNSKIAGLQSQELEDLHIARCELDYCMHCCDFLNEISDALLQDVGTESSREKVQRRNHYSGELDQLCPGWPKIFLKPKKVCLYQELAEKEGFKKWLKDLGCEIGEDTNLRPTIDGWVCCEKGVCVIPHDIHDRLYREYCKEMKIGGRI